MTTGRPRPFAAVDRGSTLAYSGRLIGVLRNWRLAAACAALAAALCFVAVVDHRDKQRRIDRAQLDEYFCVHAGVRCGGPAWRTIEHRWQIRQYGYQAAVGVLVLTALASGTLAARARVRKSSWRSAR